MISHLRLFPFFSVAWRICAAGLLLLAASTLSGAPADAALTNLRAGHPRLIVHVDTWTKLRAARETDLELAVLLAMIEREAREILTEPAADYRKTGRRLLHVSRQVQRRTITLALAFRITGDEAFLQRAERELVTSAEFADWNPSHFLDVAEMTLALALGYDWLHAELSGQTRTKIRDAIVEKGLKPALDPAAKHNGWQNADNNWNQVCFGGLILGALAIADEEPEIAGKILALSRPQLVRGLKAYAPDGAYPEGPAYWSYGTSFSVLTIAALETALGTDWEIPASPGFMASAGFVLQTTAPSGLWFNYADSVEAGSFEPILFWFARRLGNPWLVESQRAELKRFTVKSAGSDELGEAARFLPFAAIWWPIGDKTKAPPLPLRWIGDGPNPVAVFRSAWGDPQAFYLGIKGGVANLSHAHMDAGSFVLEANGVRWARDLGRQEYNSLESKGVDLWNRNQDSQRWQVFRLNNRSHNTLTIDGQLQRVDGEARIVAFSDAASKAFAIVDLAPVFAGRVAQARRGFRVRPEGAVLVQDELSGLKPGAAVTWTMATAADVVIDDDGRGATLREAGQTCEARLLAPTPADVRMKVSTADPPADGFNAGNPGRRLLLIESAAPVNGSMTLVVWIAPGAEKTKAPMEFVPLGQWETSEGATTPALEAYGR